MPFGILECKKLDVVPGTAFMNDQDDLPSQYRAIPKHQLRHGKGRFSHVILVPQPSNDPTDPLNWPQWKKESILAIVGFSAAIAAAVGPMLSSGFVEISKELGVSVNTLAQATAWLLLTIGLSLFLLNPLAKIYGKRPLYIFAVVVLFVGSVWGGVATKYNSFLGSRVISGFGLAPYEIVVQCTIGDIYFVHERATRLAFWNLCLLTGISAGTIISGYIIQDIGYRWCFWICAILFGVLMIMIILFVPETAYKRTSLVIQPNVESKFDDEESKSGAHGPITMHLEDEHNSIHSTPYPTEGANIGETIARSSINEPQPRMSYLRSLRVLTGRYSDAPIYKVFTRPFIVFFYPAVFASFLIYGLIITWTAVFSVVSAVIFVNPPYNFTVSQTGLVSLSPLILVIIGELVAGPLNDYICLYLTRRNRGIYEPEFRLVLIIVVILLGTTGFYGWGATVHYQTNWSGPVLTIGLANMSLAFAATSLFGYVIDSFPNLNEEACVAINARNLLAFGITYFINDWLAKDGALNVFCVLGSVVLFSCLLTVPLWIFGKRIRSWIARNKWLQEYMRDDD